MNMMYQKLIDVQNQSTYNSFIPLLPLLSDGYEFYCSSYGLLTLSTMKHNGKYFLINAPQSIIGCHLFIENIEFMPTTHEWIPDKLIICARESDIVLRQDETFLAQNSDGLWVLVQPFRKTQPIYVFSIVDA